MLDTPCSIMISIMFGIAGSLLIGTIAMSRVHRFAGARVKKNKNAIRSMINIVPLLLAVITVLVIYSQIPDVIHPCGKSGQKITNVIEKVLPNNALADECGCNGQRNLENKGR